MTLDLTQSQDIFQRAQHLIPGGVNSPVRAYRSVGGTPPHMRRGEGALVWDEDGNEYVDLVLSYGPLILGHGNAEVKQALHDAVETGTTFGAPTRAELRIAERIVDRVPSVEMVRLVNSGTEATLSVARLVRAATGRSALVKFNGCYHGHGDSYLVKAGSGVLTLGAPDSPGVPSALAELSLVADYNDPAGIEKLFAERGSEIAGVVVEPVAGNMGLVPPDPGYLELLRRLCDEHGALLVFDEVMTGFRVAAGGYQETCGVMPDLTCMGKVIGGGLPIGAYGGRKDLMEHIAPAGTVYQAGTLSGNPLAVAGGDKTLELLGRPGVYEGLEEASRTLAEGLEELCRKHGRPGRVQRMGSMLCLYMTDEPVRNLDDVTASDREGWTRFFHKMLEGGVHLPPSPYEAWFLSTCHEQAVLDRVLSAADRALA